MNRLATLIAIAASGCSGVSPSSTIADMAEMPGDAAPIAPYVPSDDGGQSPAVCTPSVPFCDGATTLKQCGADGLRSNAVTVSLCTGGTATNSAVCDSTGAGCPAGAAAAHSCCATRYPTCYFDVSQPWPAHDGTYELYANQTYAGSWCHSTTTQTDIVFTVHDASGNSGTISLPTGGKSPGNSYTSGWSGSMSGTPSCVALTGTVTWLQSYSWPMWGVGFSLSCGASTFSGYAYGTI